MANVAAWLKDFPRPKPLPGSIATVMKVLETAERLLRAWEKFSNSRLIFAEEPVCWWARPRWSWGRCKVFRTLGPVSRPFLLCVDFGPFGLTVGLKWLWGWWIR